MYMTKSFWAHLAFFVSVHGFGFDVTLRYDQPPNVMAHNVQTTLLLATH